MQSAEVGMKGIQAIHRYWRPETGTAALVRRRSESRKGMTDPRRYRSLAGYDWQSYSSSNSGHEASEVVSAVVSVSAVVGSIYSTAQAH